MTRYAQNTGVSIERSKAEIERMLSRYGATQFFSGWQDDPPMAAIGFRLDGRQIKITVPVPARDDTEFTLTDTGRERKPDAAYKAWEQAQRQRWRALALIIKAKIEAIETGISTVEREFLADVMLADGSTFGQWAAPQLEQIYDSGKMPPLLPAPKKTRRNQ